MVDVLDAVGKERYKFILAAPRGASFDPADDIEFIQDSSSLQGHLWEQVRLPAIMKKSEADLLWSPCGSGPLLVKKQVVTVHDASVFACGYCFKWTYRIFHRTLLPSLSKRVLHLITVSEFSRSELLSCSIGDSEKISIIYNGINTRSFSVNEDKAPVVAGKYVLTVGSRDPRKNIARLIKAWETINPDIKNDLKLVIAGGHGRGYAEEGITEVPGDIIFLGYVSQQDLATLYANATAFIYPSIYEGFGLPPLEAMACKTPVIVSNVASLPEVCGDAALYFDPFDVESIATKIIELLKDSSLQEELKRKGGERVKEFTWEKAAKELLGIFDEVLN
jgi:glycosyltransferase involved in cell wall biosynthesis